MAAKKKQTCVDLETKYVIWCPDYVGTWSYIPRGYYTGNITRKVSNTVDCWWASNTEIYNVVEAGYDRDAAKGMHFANKEIAEAIAVIMKLPSWKIKTIVRKPTTHWAASE